MTEALTSDCTDISFEEQASWCHDNQEQTDCGTGAWVAHAQVWQNYEYDA